MRGTLINAATVLAGSAAGRLGGSRLPEAVRTSVLRALGLFTLALGVSGSLRTFQSGLLSDAIITLVGLVTGAAIGTALDIEGRIERLPSGSGFLTASVVFCAGPLTILGSLRDGVSGDFSLLALKAVLDGFAALALAATYGAGVGLATLTVLVYQGGLTLGASALADAFTPDVLRALDGVGGMLVLGIGLRLLDVADVKVGNLLPALLLVPLGTAVLR